MGRGKHPKKASNESQVLHQVAKKPRQGVRTSQTKPIIDRVRQYFENEKRKGTHLNVLKRTATPTGVGTTTIKRIYAEQKNNDGQFLTPLKRYSTSRTESTQTHSIKESFAELSTPFMRG